MADQQYDNSMRGVLFRNDKKDSEKHPDYKGNGEVNGVEVWISAWIKTSQRTNTKYMSLSFENKEGQVVPGASGGQATVDVPIDSSGLPAQTGGVAADDDIPF